ncbi:DUF6397 family protein [Streptomyces sp. M19]
MRARTEDPWARAALHAAVLPQDVVASAVPDAAERDCLRRLRPSSPHRASGREPRRYARSSTGW